MELKIEIRNSLRSTASYPTHSPNKKREIRLDATPLSIFIYQ